MTIERSDQKEIAKEDLIIDVYRSTTVGQLRVAVSEKELLLSLNAPIFSLIYSSLNTHIRFLRLINIGSSMVISPMKVQQWRI